MNITVPIALFGWLPAVFVIFAVLTPRRAVITAFLIAWLFLPIAGYKIEGLPAYDKTSATCLGVLLAALLFDGARLLAFRPRWIDMPIAIWCICPFFSCITSGLTSYDGLAATVTQVIVWGIPYFIGRVYFSDLSGLRELAVGMFIGGLIYVPFCLYEIRMSPQLHIMIYGFHQHDWGQTKRYGGWRPTVFMQHGLAVGMWMCGNALLGVWLWNTKTLVRLKSLSMGSLVGVLLVTAVLCKSTGAIVLLAGGLVTFVSLKWLRTSVVVICLLVMPIAYMSLRSTGLWSGKEIAALAENAGEDDRADSVDFRLDNENTILARVWERPIFGWGWARFLARSEGQKDAVTDGLWILVAGRNGFVGLAALSAIYLLPVIVLLWNIPVNYWREPVAASAGALAVLLCLLMIDNLFNALINPIFILAAGGLGAAALQGVGVVQPGHSNVSMKYPFPVPQVFKI